MRFRKIPVEIDAIQITPAFLREMRGPLGSNLSLVSGDIEFRKDCVKISTLEGVMTGRIGDWIITGVNGEKYPCKDDIFRKTYEPVKEKE